MIYADVASVIPAKLRTTENALSPGEIDLAGSSTPPGTFSTPPQMDISPQPSTSTANVRSPSVFEPTESGIGGKEQHLITQADFNNLVRDANLSQGSAELVASRLKQWNVVATDLRVTAPRKRRLTQVFDECFEIDNTLSKELAFCNDIYRLFERIGVPYDAKDWRLFIDSSKESLKAVLLHNGNKQPSVPICYGRAIPETYDTMKQILQLIKRDEHKWKICCDLKVVGLLTGLKKGFATNQCFLCLWVGRDKCHHYTNHQWPPRITFQIGKNSIEHLPLVQGTDVILPPLHIKLGLVRNFVRAVDREGQAFAYLRAELFPKLTDAKIDNGKLK